MKVVRIKEIDGEIRVGDTDERDVRVDHGWPQGCSNCNDQQGLIEDVLTRHGRLAACRFALERLHLCRRTGVLYCDQCLTDDMRRECLSSPPGIQEKELD